MPYRVKYDGQLKWRMCVLSGILMTLAWLQFIVIGPDTLHTCHWAAGDYYGGYEDKLFRLVVSNCVLLTVSAIIVALWTGYLILQEEQDAKFPQSQQPKGIRTSPSSLVTPEEPQYFTALGRCGVERNQLPTIVDAMQASSIALDLASMAYTSMRFLIGINCTLMSLSFLVFFRLSISPSGLCFKRHRVDVDYGEEECLQASTFSVHNIRATLITVLMILTLLIFYGFSYVQTFATAPKFFTSHQLRLLQDDTSEFNQILQVHNWTQEIKQELENHQRPLDRVLLIVLDGMRYDYVQKNAAFRHLVYEGPRAPDFIVHRIEARLPAMSVPNWITILSGVSPEISGTRGNLYDGELEFDTLYSRMARTDSQTAEFMRGLNGCDWWCGLVQSYLPRTKGHSCSNAYSMYDAVRKYMPIAEALDIDINFKAAGEQAVPPSYLFWISESPEGNGYSDDTSDRARVYTTIQALNDTHDPFRFYLLHLAQIDTKSHYEGTTIEFNPTNSYNRAVTNTARYISKILDSLDSQSWPHSTTVIITADHGEVDAGGHGGVEQVLRDIPFIVYRKGGQALNASLENEEMEKVYQFLQKNKRPAFINDVPMTVSQLLDLPAPRVSSGWPAPDPLPWLLWPKDEIHFRIRRQVRDWFELTRERTNLFLVQAPMTTRQWCRLRAHHPFLDRLHDMPQNATMDQMLEAAKDLMEVYEHTRSQLLSRMQARNVVVSILFVFFWLWFYACILSEHTSLDTSWLTPWYYYESKSRLPIIHARSRIHSSSASSSSCCSPSLWMPSNPYFSSWRGLNLLAFIAALLITATYIGVMFIVCSIYYAQAGYPRWDSTYVHSVPAISRFLQLILITGSISSFILNRLYHVPFMLWASEPLNLKHRDQPQWECWRAMVLLWVNFWRMFFIERTFRRGYVRDLSYCYMVRYYLCFLGFVCWGTLIIAQGASGFFLTFMYDIPFHTNETWTNRFRILSMELALVPFLLGNAASLLSFSGRNQNQVSWSIFQASRSTSILACGQDECLTQNKNPNGRVSTSSRVGSQRLRKSSIRERV